MTIIPINLVLELRATDGSSTEYFQTNEEHVKKTMYLLSSTRLMTQPQLVLASEHGVDVVPVRGIDMVLARVSAQTPTILPLILPAGLLDILEAGEETTGGSLRGMGGDGGSQPPKQLVSRVEVHTLGGWKVALEIVKITGTTLHDQRQWFAHFMNLPVVSFRLRGGGIGLINQNNVTRIRAFSAPDGIPSTALPMELRSQTPPEMRSPDNLESPPIHHNEPVNG